MSDDNLPRGVWRVPFTFRGRTVLCAVNRRGDCVKLLTVKNDAPDDVPDGDPHLELVFTERLRGYLDHVDPLPMLRVIR